MLRENNKCDRIPFLVFIGARSYAGDVLLWDMLYTLETDSVGK
jgi:hypothetical protein